MQSVIISFFYQLIASIWVLFKKSGTYMLFDKIYNAVSNSWKNSVIVNVLKRDADTDAIAKSSILYKILNSPFVFMTFLRDKLGSFLKKRVKNSYFVSMGKNFMQNAIACNSRFFGVMILGFGISYAILKSLDNIGILILIVCVILGGILSIGNYNITSFLKDSKFIGFLQKLTGFEIRFDFYKGKYTKGNSRLILPAIIGLAMGIIATESVIFSLALPIGLFGLTTVLYAPIIGVFFAVFASPFVPTIVLAMLCVLTIISLIINSLIKPYFKWKFDGVGVGILLLLIMFFASAATSFAVINSITVWIMYFIFMGFYFVIINTVKTKQQLYGLLKVFVIAGAFVALYGILQYVFGWNTNNAWIDETMFENDVMRVYSTLENPNVLGEYLLLVLPISAVFLCEYKLKQLHGWVYGIITAMLFVCLILTQSRGCWLGIVLASIVFITFINGRWWGVIPVLIVILPFIMPQTIVDRLLSIGNMDDSSTSYRVFIWFGTLAMLKDFWIGGIGMGEKAFNSVYPFYSYNAIIAPHSHNLFLQLVTESGICALIVFVVLMIVFVKKMVLVYSRDVKESMNSMMSIAFISGVVGFLLQSMFDYTFYNYRVMAMFFMFLAMGMALKYVTKVNVGHSDRRE